MGLIELRYSSGVVGCNINGFDSSNLLLLLVASLLTVLVWRLLAPTKIKFYHGKSAVTIQTHGGQRGAFTDLCRSIAPAARLNPFLSNGHLQTIWNTSPFRKIAVEYRRWTFEQEDSKYPGSFAVDFVVRPSSGPSSRRRRRDFTEEEFRAFPSDDRKPMLVVLHGLGGGSGELYIRETLDAVSRTGAWESCLVISRGCSRTKLTSKLFYNAAATWDLKQFVQWLRCTFPNRPLYGLGFSLGANIMTRYVGEEGSDCAFRAAIAVSNPWDLNVGSLLLRQRWIGRNLYLRALGSSLKTLFFKHPEAVKLNPAIDPEAVRKVKYLHDFDRVVQLPMWGYPTVGTYYRDASSVDSLLRVEIPFLAVHAADDPIAVVEAVPKEEFEASSYAVLCETDRGGHLGWFSLRGRRWVLELVIAWLQEMETSIIGDKT